MFVIYVNSAQSYTKFMRYALKKAEKVLKLGKICDFLPHFAKFEAYFGCREEFLN